MANRGRRDFLKHGLIAAGGLGLGLAAWSRYAARGSVPQFHPALGPLVPVKDLTTGVPLLKLPQGFRYHSFAWAGETLSDGYMAPGACDGMGVVTDENGVVTLIRNHELRGSSEPMGNPQNAWDNTGGGTTTLRFDIRNERLLESRISLNGTLNNCAGGVTPWGTWLSCEEAALTPDLMHYGIESRQMLWDIASAQKTHGWVFEVYPDGETDPRPITQMGQFYHEATAIDPETSVVYMTEDRAPDAGLYRYLPDVPGDLHAGGKLQMLKVDGYREMKDAAPLNQSMTFEWVDIADPMQGHTPGTHDGAGVVAQGMAEGGTGFVALEGCSYFEGSIYFTSKAGGNAAAGQVFRLDIEKQTLILIYEANGKSSFSGPDNIIVSPRGSLMICEDRHGPFTRGQVLAGLDGNGNLFSFCQSNPDLQATHAGHDLHETAARSEWAGVCFSADGQWMFANLYNPGISFAITGPWQNAPV
jgi:secreted PhoX family phosphatase